MHSTDFSVLQLVAKRAAMAPDATAVVEQQRVISYHDLELRSSQLSWHLLARGVGREQLVGLYMERSIDYVVGALAIMKAGGVYVPLDPDSPAERLRTMLDDAGARQLVTHERLMDRLPEGRWTVLNVDRLEAAGNDLVAPAQAANQLAYVIYTSGSTGKPKGVEIEHGSLFNLAQWHRQAFAILPSDRVSQFACLAFDAAVWEIWPNLAAGASIHLVPQDARTEPERLRDWIVKNGITVTFAPTPVAEHLIHLEWPRHSALRLLLTGGDVLRSRPRPDLPFQLVNNYGPTEYTVVATSGAVTSDVGGKPPSIGSPVSGTSIYILDEARNPVTPGQTGEIYIAGKGLARGYHNLPQLTSQCFVPDPFQIQERCYKTGDLGTLLPDGEIQFVGRVDDQIEIRGHRIEPEEIVNVLNQSPEVLTSVIIAHADANGDKHMTAYVVPVEGGRPRHQTLQMFLQSRLPEYMIPRQFHLMDALPLTLSGKIDRAALPNPWTAERTQGKRESEDQSVRRQVGAILSELLEVQEIGCDENFFLLGGHSLLGAQLIARLRDRFGVNLTLRSLFEAPTVAALSDLVTESLAGSAA